jgi:RNA polymerase sigma-70 factor (ECF subfamily)
MRTTTMQEPATDIIHAAARGDHQAFEALYRTSSDQVYRTALRIVNNRELAAEVTQEVFLTIYRKLPTFSFQSSFSTWLYRITVNTAINHVKKAAREQGRTVEYNEETAPSSGTAPAEDAMVDRQRQQQVSRLLAALNPDQRACIVLRNIEGLSYEEISTALQININTVRSRLKRARERLIAMGTREARDAV